MRALILLSLLTSCGPRPLFKEECDSHLYTVTEIGQCVEDVGCAVVLDNTRHVRLSGPSTIGQKLKECSIAKVTSSYFKRLEK